MSLLWWTLFFSGSGTPAVPFPSDTYETSVSYTEPARTVAWSGSSQSVTYGGPSYTVTFEE